MDWLQDSCRWWILSGILQEHPAFILCVSLKIEAPYSSKMTQCHLRWW
jgi:hypothetical protein